MDPLSISGERTERDAWLLLSRTWCGVTQSNALAAAAYLEANGFKSTDRGLPPTIVNIAIHAAWNPTLTGPLRLQTETAFERGEVAGYYAGQLIDIDAMASAGGQKIGTLYSCEGGIAYLDPPLLDGEGSEHLRARYGFQPLAVSLATRSRSCASAAD